ncbi:hypothetical protein DAPPUDRAFT_239169 [Daphnia pulex]|uniref:Uncharacterized protein n=1 Tax=Daphnia pulex TaxID=6669 RepID=E9G8I8_DAPPU|nr:hypothetical protein DAPPUDRAFT_239169 [Daphnia pulex]|eukprot:EFX84261.1 hypothetical protein DAPPUDRAFT_239169 [Daphnia pulex]
MKKIFSHRHNRDDLAALQQPEPLTQPLLPPVFSNTCLRDCLPTDIVTSIIMVAT